MSVPELDLIERLSRAVSLTVLELDVDRASLIPAFLLANMMSPVLWEWREQRRATTATGDLLSVNRRLSDLQRQFHDYTFTHIPDRPGGDPWGLLEFETEEQRLGQEFVRRMRLSYDRALRAMLAQDADNQFGRIVTEEYYDDGYFPRLRNETVEIMEAYRYVTPEGSPSGKCAALAMLWAAALMVWGRFSADEVVIVGNRAHIFVFLNEGSGHLFNNTRWFNRTRIHNRSKPSEHAKKVTSTAATTYLYCPAYGICDCDERTSEIPFDVLSGILEKIHGFLGVSLPHSDLESFSFGAGAGRFPDASHFDSVSDYQSAVRSLASELPDSIYDFAQYSFRQLTVKHPEAYARAALRDYHTEQLAERVESLETAAGIVSEIRDCGCAFGCRDRLALPDETLFFGVGDDREMALFLFALLHHSPIKRDDMAVGFGRHGSFVRFGDEWLDHLGHRIRFPESAIPLRMFDETRNWVEE